MQNSCMRPRLQPWHKDADEFAPSQTPNTHSNTHPQAAPVARVPNAHRLIEAAAHLPCKVPLITALGHMCLRHQQQPCPRGVLLRKASPLQSLHDCVLASVSGPPPLTGGDPRLREHGVCDVHRGVAVECDPTTWFMTGLNAQQKT